MENDWDSKTVIGYKKQVAKVTKKDSDLNGKSSTICAGGTFSLFLPSCKFDQPYR